MDGLARHGPWASILAIFLTVGLYVFKRLFDRALASADELRETHGRRLDDITRGVDNMHNAVVDELRELRHSLELALQGLPGQVRSAIADEPSGVRRNPLVSPPRRPTRGGGGGGG